MIYIFIHQRIYLRVGFFFIFDVICTQRETKFLVTFIGGTAVNGGTRITAPIVLVLISLFW